MDNVTRNKAYNAYVDSKTPLTKMLPSLIRAFIIGGIICIIGEAIFDGFKAIFPNLIKEDLAAATAGTLVFIASILTGLGLYERLGAFAGAGSIVPITGFSNSITAPALEFKNEGFIFGLAAKMFVIAGPVIVNGLAAAFIIGLIYLIFGI